MDNKLLYLAYDGDNAGRLVGRSILANDENSLHEVSNRINLGHEIVRKWVEEHGGKFISGGGDEGTFALPQSALDSVEELRKDYQFATNLTMTVGVGHSLSEAGKSLLAGKLRGKNQTVVFDETVDGEISQAHERVKSGGGSEEEKKLSDAYLDNPEASGANEEDVASQVDSGEQASPGIGTASEKGDEDSIPEPTADKSKEAGEQENSEDKTPLMEAGASEDTPKDTYNEKNPEENDMANKSDVNPNQQKEKSDEKADPKNKEGAGPSKEKVNASPQEGKEKAIVDSDESAECADDGCSRPPHFADKQNPGDMGTEEAPLHEEDAEGLEELDEDGNPIQGDEPMVDEEGNPIEDDGMGEEDPDFAGVLQDGLSNGADGIQKEKVVQMVSAALAGFKSQKHIMERAKQQAPELYNASIAMLKAMIEMSKMLGLDASGTGGAGDLFAPAEQEMGIDPNAEGGMPGEEGLEGEEEGAPAFGEEESEGEESEGAPADKKGFPPKKKEGESKEQKGPPAKKPAPKEGAKPPKQDRQ